MHYCVIRNAFLHNGDRKQKQVVLKTENMTKGNLTLYISDSKYWAIIQPRTTFKTALITAELHIKRQWPYLLSTGYGILEMQKWMNDYRDRRDMEIYSCCLKSWITDKQP